MFQRPNWSEGESKVVFSLLKEIMVCESQNACGVNQKGKTRSALSDGVGVFQKGTVTK